MPDAPIPADVDRAARMVAAQVGCTYNEARELMRVHVHETSQTLDQVAQAVINGTLRFDSYDD